MHQQNNIEKVYLLIKVFATSHNKAYPLRSEYLAWPAAHLPLNRGKNFVEDFRLVLYKTFSETWQTSVSTTYAKGKAPNLLYKEYLLKIYFLTSPPGTRHV